METVVNTRVIFSAVREQKAVDQIIITFDKTVTNIGNGMNPESGVFTAPVSGIYSFSLSGSRFFKTSGAVYIDVLKNEEVEFTIIEQNYYFQITKTDQEGLNQSWMMSLAQNDKVQMKLNLGLDLYFYSQIVVNFGGNSLYKTPLWFNGQLLDLTQ